MAQHGGRRSGAGRKPGQQTKATKAMKMTFADLAKEYGPECLKTAAEIMRDAKQSGTARMAAVNYLTDRAYGKATQLLGNDPENPLEMPSKVILAPHPFPDDGSDDPSAA